MTAQCVCKRQIDDLHALIINPARRTTHHKENEATDNLLPLGQYRSSSLQNVSQAETCNKRNKEHITVPHSCREF
jgi:hypothetical protein